MTELHAGPQWGGPASDRIHLPRMQAGAQPQHLLITLLGDYWYGRREHLPSAALVRLLAEFGVTPVGARAALSRLARRGLLESSKYGRRTYYRLTERAAVVIADGARRIFSFGTSSRSWSGQWTVAAFSVPEEQRDLRHALRSRLRWLGFAPLYDGVWVTAGDETAAATALLKELEIGTATVMTAAVAPGSPLSGDPLTAWDLEGLRRRYLEFADKYGPLLERIGAGEVGASEALVGRTAVMNEWRNFPNLDPDLPPELLPQPWPRAEARRVFAEVYNGLGPLALGRVRHVLAELSPELAGLARFHTTSFSG
jgi:phenylacetic acid degradation operon negative regulatory protein